ncbi:protein kinase [Kitasatospora sp. YST-16]|uniref:serine/threonine protein kinase n=1 Tax=Kitasatospora sp. YST-16 TaxID=2998080 RepID=UPI0022851239|nr:serine/threonine protein kinase [Kitasatospora sp. YST-16]WAL70229.1 protein kinase [Kitasatospora sp. YST-16]WNW36270.1 protein kinase [Streptomyces sp. Li-HN-5-13]
MTPRGGTEGAGFDLAGSGAEALEGEDPREIGGIPLLGRLGAGGMGRVYLGVVGGRYAAVKQVLPQFIEDQDFRRHFGHELDNLARLPAEATAPLLAADREGRPPWLATAYVPGLTLERVLAVNGGPLDVARLWLLLRETATALRAVHALGMIHRDLKPTNLMLTARGATLIDFGIARAADQSRLTRTGMVLGTPAYMSPEQAGNTGPFTPAVDVFALGALIAYAATGRPPFGEGSGVDMLYRIVHTEPDLSALRALSPNLAETVAACLDKDPAARPTADRLARLAAQQGPSPAEAIGWPEPAMGLLLARAAFAERPVPSPPPVSRTSVRTRALRVVRPRTESGRRRRLVLFAVPVLLAAGATTAVQLLPFGTPPRTIQGGQQPATPDGSTGHPSGAPAAGTSGTPSGSGTAPDPAGSSPTDPASAASSTPSGPDGSRSPTTTATGSAKKSTPPPPPASKPTPTPTPTPARTYGPRCVFATSATCTSDNPTVEVTSTGGYTSCTFTMTTTWGDGETTYTDVTGSGPSAPPKTYATHLYRQPGTYHIHVRAVTTSGFCLATGSDLTFTLTS